MSAFFSPEQERTWSLKCVEGYFSKASDSKSKLICSWESHPAPSDNSSLFFEEDKLYIGPLFRLWARAEPVSSGGGAASAAVAAPEAFAEAFAEALAEALAAAVTN